MPPDITRDTKFHCDLKDAELTLGTCLRDYMNANAVPKETKHDKNPCRGCLQGIRNRGTYARS